MRGQARMGTDLLLMVTHILLVASCITILEVNARYVISPQKPDYYTNSLATNLDDSDEIHGAPLRPLEGTKFSSQWRQNDRSSKDWQRKVRNSCYEDEKAPCNTDAPSCRFRDQCGKAPLNPIPKNHKDRIIHGKNQTYGEWPSFVEIVIFRAYPYYKSICGGTLISDRHVLTAAHCLDLEVSMTKILPARPSDLYLDLGTHQTDSPDQYEQKRRAKSLCVAKKFAHTFGPTTNDWALIELNEPVEFNDHVQPACLPSEPVQTRGPRSECWVVGSGASLIHPHQVIPSIVQKIRVEQVSCEPFKIGVDPTRKCFANSDEPVGNICPGDSGAPLLCLDGERRWTVVGMGHAGFNCSETNPPEQDLRFGSLYTDVASFLDDIKGQCNF